MRRPVSPGSGWCSTPGLALARHSSTICSCWTACRRLAGLGLPLLVGLSRKSMIQQLIGRPVAERLPASLGLAVLAVERGAAIIRTHDVAATADAVAMWTALEKVGDQ